MDLSRLLPGLRLANPAALLLLLALPAWYLALRRRGRVAGGMTFPHAGLLDGLPRSWRIRLLPLPDLLRTAVLALLILALSRPQLGRVREQINQRGVDIMLALDLSGSMKAEDVAPSRVEVAKRAIRRFITLAQSDRIGLVVFAGQSFTQCPLTPDYGILLELLGECHVGTVTAIGTAIGNALANCVYRFDTDQPHHEGLPGSSATTVEGKRRSRVVVLLTDGSSTQGLPVLTAAAIAKAKGVRVHCIGIGTPEGAPVPTISAGRRSYVTKEDGSLYIADLDEASLRTVAEATGGQYFRVSDQRGLERIYERIAEMEKHEIRIERLTQHEERFLAPVVAALALLLIELLLRSTVLRVTA